MLTVMKPQPRRYVRPPHSTYRPRPCRICGGQSTFAFSVLGRIIGPGTTLHRKMKTSKTVLLCERCSERPMEFLKPLGDLVNQTVQHLKAQPVVTMKTKTVCQ